MGTQKDAQPPRPVLIFDGDCGFCTSTARWLGRLLRRPGGAGAVVVPWQCADLGALGIPVERAQAEVLWHEPDGRVAGGADAFASWLRFRGGPYRLLGRLLLLGPVRPLSRLVYRWVSGNRGRLPGSPALRR